MGRFAEDHANKILAWSYIAGGLWGLILTIYGMFNVDAGAACVAIMGVFCVLYGFGIWCGNLLRVGQNRALWGILALAVLQLPIASSGAYPALPQFQYMFGILVLAPLEFGINGGLGASLHLGSQWAIVVAGSAPQFVGVNIVAFVWIRMALTGLRRAKKEKGDGEGCRAVRLGIDSGYRVRVGYIHAKYSSFG